MEKENYSRDKKKVHSSYRFLYCTYRGDISSLAQKALVFEWGKFHPKKLCKNHFLMASSALGIPPPSFTALPYMRMWIWHTKNGSYTSKRGLVFNLSRLLPYSTFTIIIRSHRISSGFEGTVPGREEMQCFLILCTNAVWENSPPTNTHHPSPSPTNALLYKRPTS